MSLLPHTPSADTALRWRWLIQLMLAEMTFVEIGLRRHEDQRHDTATRHHSCRYSAAMPPPEVVDAATPLERVTPPIRV